MKMKMTMMKLVSLLIATTMTSTTAYGKNDDSDDDECLKAEMYVERRRRVLRLMDTTQHDAMPFIMMLHCHALNCIDMHGIARVVDATNDASEPTGGACLSISVNTQAHPQAHKHPLTHTLSHSLQHRPLSPDITASRPCPRMCGPYRTFMEAHHPKAAMISK
jgi:hypothetical protein